jgi:hypothetical protein
MQQAPGFAPFGLAQTRFTMARLQLGAGPVGGKKQAKINLCGVSFEQAS